MDINCRKAVNHTLKLALRTAICRALQNCNPLSSSAALQSHLCRCWKDLAAAEMFST